MTQFQSAPASAGSEHRVKSTALALHVASAAYWGRPWRHRALSLPSPQALTFKGARLPIQPLHSWLHLLSRAGMLGVRPPAVGVLRQADEGEEDAPTRIEDLGFEMATEMILDFAGFARQSRHSSSAEEAEPEAEVAASSTGESSALGSTAGIDQSHGLGLPGSVASEALGQDSLGRELSAAQGCGEAAPVLQEQIAELAPMSETPLSLDEPRVEWIMETQDVPVVVERGESALVEPRQKVQERVELPQVSTPETAASARRTLPLVEEVVLQPVAAPVPMSFVEPVGEPSRLEAIVSEPPEVEASVHMAATEPEVEGPSDTGAVIEATVVAVPEFIVQAPMIEEPVEHRQLSAMSTALVPALEALGVEVDSKAVHEQEPESVVEAPEAAGPGIAVSGVCLARSVVARPQPTVERTSAAPSLGVSLSADESAPEVEAALQHALPAAAVDTPEASVCTTENIGAEAAMPEQSPIAAAVDQPRTDHLTPPEGTVADDFGFEPMIASLEDALAVLTVAHVVRDTAPEAKTRLNVANTSSASLAAEVMQTVDNRPEAMTLQGIFIQKETEMTEMHDESIEVEAPANAPISSAELQEVAATLSVPQLEADPDDVLSDVQSTLNSLAGMAQGLTQQKQAAGRLQEELEEWNIQLQERERLAGDKEERLLQLENHLKQAKTNLDRMAAENNRLLAERSEALKELAQTVDLRDKTTVKRAESIQLEQQRIDEQTASLRTRAGELDERESALKRRSEELGVRLKQLQSAKDKFSTIVKSFNETVQFNSTLSAISKTVNE
ncbi:hypothetical protein IB256_05905 [Pseudomonas sp. PDM17]|uniref:hypothetical protein n=1 Tax=Pseudomonas sp. PDM17 TaxID=2769285 RepID=UPI00177D542C|nr:hypothetical protein [Pseudomonas sp. PDM17]MBD9500300.1 hypothetical protein [Pseudomonas sp. PDM17]